VARRVPVWIPPAAAALILRLPLILLPGPGRDEAAYRYWAHHSEPFYAPLLQWAIRAFETLPIPDLLALRMPAIVCGVLSLMLLDRWLETVGARRTHRLLALAAIAFGPWQTYVGAIVHPDTMAFCALLAAMLAHAKRKPFAVAVAVGLGVLAKPTGLLLLPMLPILWRHERARIGLAAVAIALALSAPVLVSVDRAMIGEMLQFGRVDPTMPTLGAALIFLADLILEGGPLIPLAAVVGVATRAYRAPAVVPFGLLATYAIAAVVNGQFKCNWILPALILLWPVALFRIPRAATAVALTITIVSGAGVSLAMSRPDLVTLIERRIHADDGFYPHRAGTREARVSATRSWSDHLREFRPVDESAKAVETAWREAGRSRHPRLIIADDYGFAAQLAWVWRAEAPRIFTPADAMFRAGVDDLSQVDLKDAVVVTTLNSLDKISGGVGRTREIASIAHPVTGSTVIIGVMESRSNTLSVDENDH